MAPRPGLKQVPTIAQVIPGAYVHIVLKQDQPTGRTVRGIVQNVLTRGNHPRGIKVRLSDGRVGRVQTMDDGVQAAGGRSAAAAAAPSPGPIAAAASHVSAHGFPASDDDAGPREQLGLDAFIRPSRKQQQKRGSNTRGGGGGWGGEGGGNAVARSSTPPPETTTCPVCGDFEGDAAAVAHHVASHFDG